MEKESVRVREINARNPDELSWREQTIRYYEGQLPEEEIDQHIVRQDLESSERDAHKKVVVAMLGRRSLVENLEAAMSETAASVPEFKQYYQKLVAAENINPVDIDKIPRGHALKLPDQYPEAFQHLEGIETRLLTACSYYCARRPQDIEKVAKYHVHRSSMIARRGVGLVEPGLPDTESFINGSWRSTDDTPNPRADTDVLLADALSKEWATKFSRDEDGKIIQKEMPVSFNPRRLETYLDYEISLVSYTRSMSRKGIDDRAEKAVNNTLSFIVKEAGYQSNAASIRGLIKRLDHRIPRPPLSQQIIYSANKITLQYQEKQHKLFSELESLDIDDSNNLPRAFDRVMYACMHGVKAENMDQLQSAIHVARLLATMSIKGYRPQELSQAELQIRYPGAGEDVLLAVAAAYDTNPDESHRHRVFIEQTAPDRLSKPKIDA